MKLDAVTLDGLAERLETCQLTAQDTPKITDDHPEMDWEDAYAIQAAILARKLARGRKLAGLKAGLTSLAKMRQMGVTSPVFGWMTDDYAVPHGGEVNTAERSLRNISIGTRPLPIRRFPETSALAVTVPTSSR